MQYVFNGCESLTSLDLGNWTSSNVIVMNAMFSNCYNLQEIKGLTNLDTSQVTLLNSMFSDCTYLTELDLSSFDASAAEKLDYMFQNCSRLVTIRSMKHIRSNISIKDCVHINVESIIDIIDNLDEISVIEEWLLTLEEEKQEPLPITRVLTLGAINLAKLSPEQIKVATDKGWSVA